MNTSYHNLIITNKINKNKFQQISSQLLIELEKEFKNKNLCKICCRVELNQENTIYCDQNHSYCNICVKSYLTLQINEGKFYIKCLHSDCHEIQIENNFIAEIVDKDIFVKFLKLKTKSRFLLLNKIYVNCVINDCDQYIKINPQNENLKFKCLKGHLFCNKCKMPWHGKKSCVKVKKIII